jgi:hypothetical protein
MAGDYVKPAEINIPNFVALRMVAQDLCARAQSHLLLGESADAARELAALHRMKRLTIGNHPMTLVAAMVNVAVVGLYAETIGEGFRLNAWRAEDLAELQRQLAEIDLLPPVEEAFQFEVSSVNRTTEQSGKTYAQFFADITTGFGMGKSIQTWQERLSYCAATLAPRGWVNQNQLAYTKLMRETRALMAVNKQGCVSPSKCDAAPKLVDDLLRNFNGDSLRLIYDRPAKKTLAAIAIPNCARAMQTATRNQTRVNLSLVACALERHRLARGEYPATLDALAPEFLAQLPHDLIGGAPLKYQRTTDGKFLLYSIGWNENDDGGKISRDKDNKVNTTAPDGDWVWATK